MLSSPLTSIVLPPSPNPSVDKHQFVPRDSRRDGILFDSNLLEELSIYLDPTISMPTLLKRSPVSLPIPDTLPQVKTNSLEIPIGFDPIGLPSQASLDEALGCKVLDAYGNLIEFSQLIDRQCRTLFIFIRNFRCAYCQSYIENLSSIVNDHNEYGVISSAGIKVVIIGLGSRSMILKYRALFRCPYPIYTDASSSNKLYTALGMTRRSVAAGPEGLKGDYLESRTTSQLLKYGLKNTLKLPIFSSAGDLKQLGGELIFEPVPISKAARVPIKVSALEFSELVPKTISESPGLGLGRSILPNHRLAQASLSLDRSLHFTQTLRVAPVLLDLPSNRGDEIGRTLRQQNPTSTVKIHCKFAHRMSFTRDHMSLYDLFRYAGIRLDSNPNKRSLSW